MSTEHILARHAMLPCSSTHGPGQGHDTEWSKRSCLSFVLFLCILRPMEAVGKGVECERDSPGFGRLMVRVCLFAALRTVLHSTVQYRLP